MKARLPWLLVAVAAYFLYLHGLAEVGLLKEDEPRYASIGRAMWSSGDWTTPRLWEQQWFEKPPLLYWMIAAGHLAGLPGELAPRLPVALMSLGFLFFYWRILRREFDPEIAFKATGILATSAGWIAYSHVAVTDLPMSACFAAAMLLALRGSQRDLNLAGALLGLAALAKALVPIALALPLLWRFRNRLKDLLVPTAILVAVAAPWYVFCYFKYGREPFDVLILRHHFARFFSAATETLHARPFWFYVPVLLLGLFPWTPLAAGLFQRKLWTDPRVRYFAVWLGFGFVLFSASRGKLPGYLLPLLPAASLLLALAGGYLRAVPVLLILVTPLAVGVLPQALNDGFTRSSLHWPAYWTWPLAALALLMMRRGSFNVAISTCVIGIAIALQVARPALESTVSARLVWQAIEQRPGPWCAEDLRRAWEYGINYYAGHALPDCDTLRLSSPSLNVITSDPSHARPVFRHEEWHGGELVSSEAAFF